MTNELSKTLRKAKNNIVSFRPNRWKHFLKAGCYPYALNLEINDFFLIGDFIKKRCDYSVSDEFLKNVLLEELSFLGYTPQETEIDFALNSNQLKIYLTRDTHSGYYHFYRQDNDGMWSHKDVNRIPVRITSLEDTINKLSTGWCFVLTKK